MLDTAYMWMETMPWEKSAQHGPLAAWSLGIIGILSLGLVAHDIWYSWKRKRPR